MSKLARRVGMLEGRQPAAQHAWERIIARRLGMTAAEEADFIAAELRARGKSEGAPVILRRIMAPMPAADGAAP